MLAQSVDQFIHCAADGLERRHVDAFECALLTFDAIRPARQQRLGGIRHGETDLRRHKDRAAASVPRARGPFHQILPHMRSTEQRSRLWAGRCKDVPREDRQPVEPVTQRAKGLLQGRQREALEVC